MLNVLLVVERKKKIGRNDWRRDIKKILSTKIHTYIHGRNAPKSKEIFTKKISNCKKK